MIVTVPVPDDLTAAPRKSLVETSMFSSVTSPLPLKVIPLLILSALTVSSSALIVTLPLTVLPVNVAAPPSLLY